MSDAMQTMVVRQPKVSVIILTYNQKDFVRIAVESVVRQDYENLEVVVSDDASTDGTADIVAALQMEYPNRVVALLSERNAGITANSNKALRACTGEFIGFLGGDDVFLPGKVGAQVAWFLENPSRVLCGHWVEIILADGSKCPDSGLSKLTEGRGPHAYIREGALFPAQSVMVRASAIPVHGFDPSIPIASDLLFAIEVLIPDGQYGYVEGIYAQYRAHGSNVTFRYEEITKDLETTYLLVGQRYPQYRALCEDALVRHVIYYGGVRLLRMGRKRDAQRKFWQAIVQKPFMLKAWIRWLQSL